MKPFAEVIESSLIHWLAQSWEWDVSPAFGSLVTAQDQERTIVGVVQTIQTGSLDPSRYPFAYKKTEAELRKEQPQIFEFLKTTFSVGILGYIENNRLWHMLPPHPARIHAFVQQAPDSLYHDLFATHDYLQLLFNQPPSATPIDELLLAMLREQRKRNLLTNVTLHAFAKEFSLASRNDYRRLKLFFQRAQTLVTPQ